MTASLIFYYISDHVLIFFFLFLLVSSLYISAKTGWIQITGLRRVWKILRQRSSTEKEGEYTVNPLSALFTAMSTTIGLGNIVGPVVVIGMGGPGALIGYLIATICSSSVTFAEVYYALSYRKKETDGSFSGGPMPYIRAALGWRAAAAYAIFGVFLLTAWSGNQANSFVLLLQNSGASPYYTGIIIAASYFITLCGGIKLLGRINALLVPAMFVFYCSACFYILFQSAHHIIPALKLMFSFSTPPIHEMWIGLSVHQMLRWGLAKALQANEAGVGTASFPHSASDTHSPVKQGMIAMVSVYANGCLCLLSGLTILTSQVWKLQGVPFDIRMIQHLFNQYFPFFGNIALIVSAFLFSYGTIIGNGYNGEQCFTYLFSRKSALLYRFLTGIVLFLGCIADVRFIWTIIDFLVLPVAILNTIAIVLLTYKDGSKLSAHLRQE